MLTGPELQPSTASRTASRPPPSQVKLNTRSRSTSAEAGPSWASTFPNLTPPNPRSAARPRSPASPTSSPPDSHNYPPRPSTADEGCGVSKLGAPLTSGSTWSRPRPSGVFELRGESHPLHQPQYALPESRQCPLWGRQPPGEFPGQPRD